MWLLKVVFEWNYHYYCSSLNRNRRVEKLQLPNAGDKLLAPSLTASAPSGELKEPQLALLQALLTEVTIRLSREIHTHNYKCLFQLPSNISRAKKQHVFWALPCYSYSEICVCEINTSVELCGCAVEFGPTETY